MTIRKLSRRRFLAALGVLAPVCTVLDAFLVEPTWLKVRTVQLGAGKVAHRIAHITDIHHVGNRKYLEKVVAKLNGLAPDLICFTGDLIDEEKHLDEALRILRRVGSPLYGIPGNHDYWSKATFEPIEACFSATGGGWLRNQQVLARGGQVAITGVGSESLRHLPLRPHPSARNICLLHFPAWADRLGDARFDLILAGHSHGGQVRLPLRGAIMVPYAVEGYDRGLFQTRAGPLYVNPGIGYYPVPVRFLCRPEITLFEL